MTVRTRFAPSPTGSLHVGGVRTALYCWLYARHHGGRFVLRIEDTDKARSSEEAARGIVRDMAWLGLDWDEGPEVGGEHGPYRQSEKLDAYRAVVAGLVAAGHAYEAYETREELEALRAASGEGFKYRRRAYSADDLAGFAAEGRQPVVRLAVPTDAPYVVDDQIVGSVEVPGEEMDDLVILKADGYPTYHLAVVIDDRDMAITHVMRGQEHLKNTHKHLALARALGIELPAVGHLPIIFNPRGSKMSKRDKAKVARAAARAEAKTRGAADWAWLADLASRGEAEVTSFMGKQHDDIATAVAVAGALDVELPGIDVMDFRTAGYLPEALLNYLALLGWSPGDDREVMTLDELVAAFELGRVQKTPARFDPDKLRWMNGEHVRRASSARLEAAFADWLTLVPDSPLAALDAERRRALLALYKDRYVTFTDLEQQAASVLLAPTAWDDKAVKKHLLKGGGVERLAEVAAVLQAAEWTATGIDAALEALCASRDYRLGKIAQPLRVAVTGTAVSPPIGDTLAFLDRADVLARIATTVAAHAS